MREAVPGRHRPEFVGNVGTGAVPAPRGAAVAFVAVLVIIGGVIAAVSIVLAGVLSATAPGAEWHPPVEPSTVGYAP